MRTIGRCSARWTATCLVVWAGIFGGILQAASETAESTDKRIGRLIEQLGASDFHARQRAQQELLKIGVAAIDALNDATDHDDLEIAERARYLLKLIPIELVREGDPASIKHWLENYDTLDPD